MPSLFTKWIFLVQQFHIYKKATPGFFLFLSNWFIENRMILKVIHFHKMSVGWTFQCRNKLDKKNRFMSEGPIRKKPTPFSPPVFRSSPLNPIYQSNEWNFHNNAVDQKNQRSASWKVQNEQYIKKILLKTFNYS